MAFFENLLVQDSLILVLALALSAVAYYVVKEYVLQWLYSFFRKTPTKWDQFLFEQGVRSSFQSGLKNL